MPPDEQANFLAHCEEIRIKEKEREEKKKARKKKTTKKKTKKKDKNVLKLTPAEYKLLKKAGLI